jgi:hypothetical protein
MPYAEAKYPELRELAQRTSGELVVTLWWDEQGTDVAVSVADGNGSGFQLVIAGCEALHAFHHPFAVAAARDLSAQGSAA